MKSLYYLILFTFIWSAQGNAEYAVEVNLMTELEKCMKRNRLEKSNYPKLKCTYQDPTNLFSIDFEISITNRDKTYLVYRYVDLGKNRSMVDYAYSQVDFKISWREGIKPLEISPIFKSNQDLSAIDSFLHQTTGYYFLGGSQSLAAKNYPDLFIFSSHTCKMYFQDDSMRTLLGGMVIDGNLRSEYKIFYGTSSTNSFFSAYDKSKSGGCLRQMEIPNVVFQEKIELKNLIPGIVKFYYPDSLGDIHPYYLKKRKDIRKGLKKTSLMYELVHSTYSEISYFHSQLQSRLRENYQKAFDYCFESSDKLKHVKYLEALNQESRNSIRELLNCIDLVSPLLKLHEGSYLDDQVLGIFGVRKFFLEGFGWQDSSQGLPSIKIVNSFEQILSSLNFLRDTYKLQIPTAYKTDAGNDLEMELMGQLNEFQSFQVEIAGDLSPEMNEAIRSLSRLWNATTLQENLERFQKYQKDLIKESREEEARSIQSYLEKINSEIEIINSNLNTEDQFKVFLMEKE